MSAPAFTAGPWHAQDLKQRHPRFGVITAKNIIVARSWIEPDARLIAAAPELYEAAQLWADYDALLRKYAGPQPVLFDGDVPEVDAAYDKARDATFAALAKARGES